MIDVFFNYFLYYLPSFILTFFAFLIGIAIYFVGKKKNIYLMNQFSSKFNEAIEGRVNNLDLKEHSTVGRTYLGETKENLSLRNFRLHFTMVKRHLILSKAGAILRNIHDYVLLEADPSDNVVKRYQLEILQKNDMKRIKALSDMLQTLETIELGDKIKQFFIIKTNDKNLFLACFREDKNILKKIYAQRNFIVRISYYPLESPSIHLVAEMREGLNPKFLIDILFDLTTIITKLGKSGYYSKQRETQRIVKDKTIEKDKRDFK